MRSRSRWCAAVSLTVALSACSGGTSPETRLENAARAKDGSGSLDPYDRKQLHAWAQQICAGIFVRKADLGISDRGALALEEAAHQELCPDRPKKGV